MRNALYTNQRKHTKTVWNTTLKSLILITTTGNSQPCIVLSGEKQQEKDAICSRLRDMDKQSSNMNYVKDVLIIYLVALQDGYAKIVEDYFFPKLVTQTI